MMGLTWSRRPFDALTLIELHDLMKLRVDVFVVEQACAYAELDGQDRTALHLLGHNAAAELVAYARILPPQTDGLPHLGRIIVRASDRNKGIATTLMHYALEALQDHHGSTRSALAAQAHLEAFYARFGYVRNSENYDWDGIPHVDMVRMT